MQLLITNSSGGLCFQNKPIENNDILIISSLIDSIQTISKKLYPTNLQKTILNFKTKRIIIYSSIKNNFIFIFNINEDLKKDINISEDEFKIIYKLFIKEIIRDPFYNEDSFIKSKIFLNEIELFLKKFK